MGINISYGWDMCVRLLRKYWDRLSLLDTGYWKLFITSSKEVAVLRHWPMTVYVKHYYVTTPFFLYTTPFIKIIGQFRFADIEIYHSSPSSAGVNNEWRCNSTPTMLLWPAEGRLHFAYFTWCNGRRLHTPINRLCHLSDECLHRFCWNLTWRTSNKLCFVISIFSPVIWY